jgi:sulfite exporter TauE/SafE
VIFLLSEVHCIAMCSHQSVRVSVGDIATPTRTRKQLDLPVSGLMQPKSQDSTEVDSKMKEIMKMNGILNINGKVNITK